MVTIRALARTFSLSRSTLLYYDRIGLLPADGRNQSGYRIYSQDAVERLQKIVELRKLGLDLARISTILDGTEAARHRLLAERAAEVQGELRALFEQLRLLHRVLGQASWPVALMDRQRWSHLMASFGLDETQMLEWHRAFERQAPSAHEHFLHGLGLPQKEIDAIRQRCQL
jgi:DNA-binding transcriptional MerR regulator